MRANRYLAVARDFNKAGRFLGVRIGGAVGIFQGDIIGGLVFGNDFPSLVGLGFQDEDFDVVRAFGIFGDWERIGRDGARRLNAGAFQQTADNQGFGGVFRHVGNHYAFVGIFLGHMGSSKTVRQYYCAPPALGSILVFR